MNLIYVFISANEKAKGRGSCIATSLLSDLLSAITDKSE